MATIASCFSVAANGDIRYTGDGHGGADPGYFTVIAFHRWLQDLADNASSSGDDVLDITDSTPSERSTDNIITLLAPFNIDDTAAEHLYDGSITQAGGDTVYSGLVVVGAVETGTQLQIVQDNAIVTSYWGTGLNDDAAANILLRLCLKTRDTGADIDGKRIRVQARELSDTFAEFSLTLGQGNATAAVFTSNDLNNQTAIGTIAGWTDIVNITEGYQGLDVNGNGSDEYYYSQWDKGAHSINALYERTKWLSRRGSTEQVYGMDGELFRGISHQWAYTGETGGGSWTQNEELTWGSGATAGSGALLAVDDQGTTGTMWIQLLTGVPPAASATVTGGTSAKTATVNGSPTARTVKPEFIGTSTGAALIGGFGVGVQVADLTASDLLFDLSNNPITPPNNVQTSVGPGLITGEDYVLVGPEAGGTFDLDQLTLDGTYSGGESTVTVHEDIPTDSPKPGSIRVFDGSTYVKVSYTTFSGKSFTGCSGMPAASDGANTFISYIDKLAASGTESFTVVYSAARSLRVRVRDGGASPIKTFETTGSLGSSVAPIRTPDL